MRLAALRSIRYKLFFLLLVMTILPLTMYSFIVITQISRQMEILGLHSADQSLAQSTHYMESRIDLVKRALDLLTLNSSLREMAAASPQPYDGDPGLWIKDTNAILDLEDSIAQNNPDIRSFALYMAGGPGASTFSLTSPLFLSLKTHADEDWYKALDAGLSTPYWLPPSQSFGDGTGGDIHVLRRIPDDLNLQTTVGWARANVKIKGFERILDNAEFTPDSPAYIVADNRIVVKSNHAATIGEAALVNLANSAKGPWTRERLSGEYFRVGKRGIGETGWDLVIAIPQRDIGALGLQARNLFFLVLLSILPLMVFLAFWAAATSTKRINVLVDGVRRLGTGALDVVLPEAGSDEITELTRTFNAMVGQMGNLVDERYRLGIEVKTLELRALQSQINPHFLYNSLDLISALALRSSQPRIVEAVSALSRFYRLSLSAGADCIPLGLEISHVKAYLQIQNMRFDGAVQLEVQMGEDLESIPVMKMILQPLVENSMLHGILEKPSERGTITIRAARDQGKLVLEVEDDGVGISEERLTNLLSREPLPLAGHNGHGYGVFNIDRRLRLRYGEDSGLVYTSSFGHGTLVRISLPIEA